MTEVLNLIQIPSIRQANRTQLADFFECAPQSIDDWVRSGMPVIKRPTPKDKGWMFDIRACCEWKVKRDIGFSEETIDPSMLGPKDRKDWYDSELKRIQMEEKIGLLIPKEKAERVISTSFSVIAQNLRSIPDNIERKLSVSPEVIAEIEKSHDAYLDDLSVSLSKLVES